jgi:glycosyltransferase involved in cell wall biosynthesis
MKIHFFTKREKRGGSSRQRAFFVSEELNKRGGNSDIHSPSGATISETPWPKKMKLVWQHVVGLKDIQKEDVLYLERPINNKYLVVLLVLYKIFFRRKMIFDMDDTVFVYLPHKTKFFTKFCDAITVGNHYLYDWAKQYNPNVHIVPTAIHFEKYSAFTRDYALVNEKFTIGWIGGAKWHYDNLQLLVPIFQKLVANSIPFKFVLIGASGDEKVHRLFTEIEGLDVEFIGDLNDWSNPSESASQLQKFDIGIMPLVDKVSKRGKSAYKAIEYMACGVVPIISPVGENSYLVQDGVNGFLANGTDEWVEKITHIYNHRELCPEIGRKAQQTIKERYSFDAIVPKIIEICQKLSAQ